MGEEDQPPSNDGDVDRRDLEEEGLVSAVCIIPVTRVSDVVKWGRLYLIL